MGEVEISTFSTSRSAKTPAKPLNFHIFHFFPLRIFRVFRARSVCSALNKPVPRHVVPPSGGSGGFRTSPNKTPSLTLLGDLLFFRKKAARKCTNQRKNLKKNRLAKLPEVPKVARGCQDLAKGCQTLPPLPRVRVFTLQRLNEPEKM